jgi:hypothetical protein
MQEFLTYLVIKSLGPLNAVAKGFTFFPGSIMAIGALKTPDMQPQGDRAIEDGQIADTPVSALFDPRTAALAVRANEVRFSAFKMQLEFMGLDDLTDDPEFWQFQ